MLITPRLRVRHQVNQSMTGRNFTYRASLPAEASNREHVTVASLSPTHLTSKTSWCVVRTDPIPEIIGSGRSGYPNRAMQRLGQCLSNISLCNLDVTSPDFGPVIVLFGNLNASMWCAIW